MLFLIIAIVAAIFWLPLDWGIAAILLGMVVEVGEVAFWIRISQRRRARFGAETLVGSEGIAVSDCRPEGRVRVHGEVWSAACPEGVSAGEPIVVESVTGLTLQVRRK